MALRGRRHWLAIDGLGGPSYKFPQFLAASGIVEMVLANTSTKLAPFLYEDFQVARVGLEEAGVRSRGRAEFFERAFYWGDGGRQVGYRPLQDGHARCPEEFFLVAEISVYRTFSNARAPSAMTWTSALRKPSSAKVAIACSTIAPLFRWDSVTVVARWLMFGSGG